MKKFRLLALLLVATMSLSMLYGCGSKKDTDSKDETSNKTDTADKDSGDAKEQSSIDVDTSNKGYITTKDAFVEKIGELVDLSLYGELSESDLSSSTSYSYNMKYENKKEYDLDYKWELGDGSEFTMPITFADLEKEGWKLQENTDTERELKYGYMTWGIIENSAGKTLRVAAYNPTKDPLAFGKCTVINVDSTQFDSADSMKKLDTAIDFTVCDSITNASTLEDIIEELGAPTLISCYIHEDDNGEYTDTDVQLTYTQKSSAYSNIMFELSGDGNYIISVSYDVAPEQ